MRRSTRAILATGFLTAVMLRAEVTRDGEAYLLKGRHYNARVDGTSGLLTAFDIAGAPAVVGMEINLTEVKTPSIAVAQEGADQVVVRISGDDAKGQSLDNAYTLRYIAGEDRLTVKILGTVGRVCGRGPAFTLAPSAQAVRALDHKELIALPALSARMPWQRVKIHFGDGRTLGLLNSGAGNPFNPNENGQVAGLRYSRGGFVANSTYTYEFIPEKGTGATPAALVKGQDRARTLDFGMGGAVRAFLYPGPERQVVLLWAAGNRIPADAPDPTVSVRLACSSAPRMLDCFGNALPAPSRRTAPIPSRWEPSRSTWNCRPT